MQRIYKKNSIVQKNRSNYSYAFIQFHLNIKFGLHSMLNQYKEKEFKLGVEL